MEKKIQERYIDHGLGFSVIILHAPMVKMRGSWALHVNHNDYQKLVLTLLAQKLSKLTGSQIQFIRKYFQMTVRSFAERFAIRHSAVIKWEKTKDSSTKMSWTTEKDVRLFILDELSKKAADVHNLYKLLKNEARESSDLLKIDAGDMAA